MQRRRFIRNFAWLTGGLLVGCNKKVFSSSETGRQLKGFVKSAGKGIANVIVSDGYNVVATNDKGAYDFEMNHNADAVFISTPKGYEFKHSRSDR